MDLKKRLKNNPKNEFTMVKFLKLFKVVKLLNIISVLNSSSIGAVIDINFKFCTTSDR